MNWSWRAAIAGGEAPSPRLGSRAVSSGSLVWLFGGASQEGCFNTLHVYVPGLMTFYELSLPGSPSPRYDHSMAYVKESEDHEGGIFVIGGGSEISQDLAVWQLCGVDKVEKNAKIAIDKLCAVAPNAPQSDTPSAPQLGDGSVPEDQNLETVFKTVHWKEVSTKGTRPSPRSLFSLSHLKSSQGDELFIYGGASTCADAALGLMFALSLRTLTWREIEARGVMPGSRNGMCSVAVNNRLIITAGLGDDGHTMFPLDHAYIFSADTEEWTKQTIEGEIASPRTGACCAPLSPKLGEEPSHMLMFSGIDPFCNKVYPETWMLDLVNWKWIMVSKENEDSPPPRLDCAVTVVTAEKSALAQFEADCQNQKNNGGAPVKTDAVMEQQVHVFGGMGLGILYQDVWILAQD